MSGTGSDSGFGSEPTSSCSDLEVETSLSSPDPEVVKEIKTNDVLSVDLVKKNGKTIIAALFKGTYAGSITDSIGSLTRCIQEGYKFVGVVLLAREGLVKIRIQVTI